MPQLAIIADDLTGAADAAAPFASAGRATYVAVDHDDLPDCDVLSLSTASRHFSAEQAYDAAYAATVRVAQSRWLFKKIDSTLRGQLSAELSAVMAASRRARALIAPAFPAQSRTTVGGRQFVRGQALEETPFAHDVLSSDLLEIWPLAQLIDLQTV